MVHNSFAFIDITRQHTRYSPGNTLATKNQITQKIWIIDAIRIA